MSDNLRKRLVFLAKLIISLAIIYLILNRIDIKKIADFYRNLSFATVAGLVFLLLINLSLQLFRWRIILENHLEDIALKDVLKSLFFGFSLRLLIPGGYAEIGKMLMVKGKRSHRIFAFGSEKYITAITQIFLIAFSGFIIFPTYKVVWGIVAVIAICLGIFYPLFPRIKLLKNYLNGREHFFSSLYKVSLLTILVYIVVTLQYRLIFPDKIQIGLITLFGAVMFLIGAAMLPISFSGLGLREGMGIYIFSNWGVPPESIVGMTLCIFLINTVVPALIGAVIIFAERKKGGDG